jgi:hypothetical protein
MSTPREEQLGPISIITPANDGYGRVTGDLLIENNILIDNEIFVGGQELSASHVQNNSNVTGVTVADALDTLSGSSGAVDSVFGRTGAIVAAVSDYDASQVDNDSTVTGASVAAALNQLNSDIPQNFSQVLNNGNTTNGNDIVLSSGDSITSNSTFVSIDDNATVTGILSTNNIFYPWQTSLPPLSTSGFYWDTGFDCPTVKDSTGFFRRIGQDTDYMAVNDDISSFSAGQVANITGGAGSINGGIKVKKGDYTNASLSNFILGVAAESITTSSTGKFVRFGKVYGIDTSSFNVNDILYLGTSGNLVNVKPSVNSIPIGIVDFIGVVNGVIFVDIGFKISHGNLNDLLNDDHTQYSLADGTRAFTGVVSGVTPTADAHLVTKGYVDGIINVQTGSITTTDGIATPLMTISTSTNETLFVTARVTAFGSFFRAAGYEIKGVFKNVTGTLSQVGSTLVVMEREDYPPYGGVSFGITGTNIIVYVQGVISNTIEWNGRVYID